MCRETQRERDRQTPGSAHNEPHGAVGDGTDEAIFRLIEWRRHWGVFGIRSGIVCGTVMEGSDHRGGWVGPECVCVCVCVSVCLSVCLSVSE